MQTKTNLSSSGSFWTDAYYASTAGYVRKQGCKKVT